MDSSVYCLPADLLGEGAERVAGTVRDRAGVPGVTVAACYHPKVHIRPTPSPVQPNSYDVDAATMHMERHEGGIHAF